MDPTRTLFFIQLTDGYFLRNALYTVKCETDYVTMFFSQRAIEMSFVNKKTCAVNVVTLNTSEFGRYWYGFTDEAGNKTPEYPITVETNELFNTVKPVGRKDGVLMYLQPNDNRIFVRPLKTKESGQAGAMFVNVVNMQPERHKLPEGYHEDPNVRVLAKSFSDVCQTVSVLKCSCLEIVGYRNSVIFNGIYPNNKPACTNKFVSQNSALQQPVPEIQPNFDAIDAMIASLKLSEPVANAGSPANGFTLNIVQNEDIMRVRIPLATVKSFTKFYNVAFGSTSLKWWFMPGRPIKLECPIGNIGTYVVGFRDAPEVARQMVPTAPAPSYAAPVPVPMAPQPKQQQTWV